MRKKNSEKHNYLCMRNGNAMHNTRILPLVVSVNAIRMFGLYRDSPKKKKKKMKMKMKKNEYLSIYLSVYELSS